MPPTVADAATDSPPGVEGAEALARQLRSQFAEIAELAGGLAHEIRNPLSTMRLNLDLLAEDFGPAETVRDRRALEKVERVRRETLRLEDLLEEFLRYVRVAGIRPAPADLNAVVDDLRDFCEPQAMAQGIVTRAHYEPSLPPIALDVDQFKQALLNLVRNAQQAMPDGGELIVQTRREGPWAAVDVIDTGRGIDPEVQPRIFEAFYSTRPKGTGLGLSTTRRIVEAHGGSIEVSSEPGRGSQFTVRLPVPAPLPVPGDG